MIKGLPDWNLSSISIYELNQKEKKSRGGEGKQYLYSCISGEVSTFPLYFSFSLAVETHRNKSLCSSKCPHFILDGISNKGTVSCKEYYISLIVLQIPFLIKIKIFIVTTSVYSLQMCVFLVCLEDDALDTSFFFLSFFQKEAALVRKIYSNWFCLFVAAAIKTPKQN